MTRGKKTRGQGRQGRQGSGGAGEAGEVGGEKPLTTPHTSHPTPYLLVTSH
ncbi:hypothetical protein [Chroococcidiopsis sp. SAG 2025]|uniref:hypothetical protein n=1 Tax=Chroococcidiopsis sp. SAG 2025 TaxID=171389 RepID=UPI002937110E|nr:hypothetical protein [Chroococcidiopsis sp. SAG 2025]